MRISRLVLLVALALAAISHRSDGQQVRPLSEQLKLAAVMPRGAMVYLQTRDLSAVMKRWLASPMRDHFYKSPSFTSFAGSRIYVKLQDRKADFEKAIGFGLGEDRLAELAGGLSAVSVYDIGKLELVFVTEMPRAQAVATSLFKEAPQFQERASGDSAYYVHDVTTDGGRLNEQFCFAYAGGRLIVTTTEGLMIRALGNAKAAGTDSLLADVMATSERASGLATHDITMWIDQAKLNKSRHFNSYWIYHNESKGAADSLANIETGLLDVRFAADGMHEQRWFVLKTDEGKDGAIAAEQANGLMRLVPPSAQFVEVHGAPATTDDLGSTVSRSLFGKLPDESSTGPTSADGTSQSSRNSEDHGSTERYSRLDTRFDVDVDDEHAPKLGGKGPAPPNASRKGSTSDRDMRFAKAIASVLSKVSPAGYCEMARSSLDAGKPFARFERAVVIELGSAGALDRAALEQTITDELRARFVVSGTEPALEWRDEANVRYLAQSLLEQGAAYSVSGKYLILASNKELARDVLQAAANPPPVTASSIEGRASLFALVRVSDSKPVFDKLMSKLDGSSGETGAGSNDNESKDDQSKEETTKQEVKFFRDNLSSLVSASGIRKLRLQREISGSMMVERVNYSW
ncbi:MAG TPA: hypothetical protein VN345_18850 [Blastocatellia bacterium]|nr:hypothetical protein [Blastocatellia bacterium]